MSTQGSFSHGRPITLAANMTSGAFQTISSVYSIIDGKCTIEQLLLFSPNDHFVIKRPTKWQISCHLVMCYNYHDFVSGELLSLQSTSLTLEHATNQAQMPTFNQLLSGVVDPMTGKLEFEGQSMILNRLDASLVLEVMKWTRQPNGHYLKSKAKDFQGACHLTFEKIA